jgi:hypothetical protein
LGSEHDPTIGAQEGTFDFTLPKRPIRKKMKRPIRKKIKDLPAFTPITGGAYFFLPSVKALAYLAALAGESVLLSRASC